MKRLLSLLMLAGPIVPGVTAEPLRALQITDVGEYSYSGNSVLPGSVVKGVFGVRVVSSDFNAYEDITFKVTVKGRTSSPYTWVFPETLVERGSGVSYYGDLASYSPLFRRKSFKGQASIALYNQLGELQDSETFSIRTSNSKCRKRKGQKIWRKWHRTHCSLSVEELSNEDAFELADALRSALRGPIVLEPKAGAKH